MKNTKSLHIKVFGLNTTFTINVTTDLGPDAEIEIDYGIDVLMAYTTSVWPTRGDFRLSCIRNGVVLASSVLRNQIVEMEIVSDLIDSRYSFAFENNQLIVSIKEADVFDSGVYTVRGQNSNSFANESITLVINGLPYIKLNHNDHFFELNRLYTLHFDIISFPISNFTFARHQCSETECGPPKSSAKWIELFDQDFYRQFNLSSPVEQRFSIQNEDHNITVKSFEKPKYYQIELKLLANRSSIYKCEVENSFGSTSTSLPALVSDAGPEGFELTVLNRELIENDNITLVCKASKFNYTRIYWNWSLHRSGAKATVNLKAAAPFEKLIETSETSHSLTSQLTILNAKQNASGDYRCNAEYKEEPDATYEPNTKQLQLMIEQMVPPKMLKTNMAPDQIPLKVIEVYQTTSIDLYCEVDGRPKPSIVWKKNNMPLNLTGQSGIEFNRNNQHLSIKRLVNDDSRFFIFKINSKSSTIVRFISPLNYLGGRYECEVSNKGGLLKRALGLKVRNKNDSSMPLAGLGMHSFLFLAFPHLSDNFSSYSRYSYLHGDRLCVRGDGRVPWQTNTRRSKTKARTGNVHTEAVQSRKHTVQSGPAT